MTFKEFAVGFLQLPGTMFSGITSFIFGSHQKDQHADYRVIENKRGYTQTDENGNELYHESFSVMGTLAKVTRAIGNFVDNHKTEISSAFWISLLLGGAAALTAFFWPAGLAFVVNFPVAGYTIAEIVGTGLAAQIAAVSGLTAAASSAAVYACAAVVNTSIALVKGISSLFTSSTPAPSSGNANAGNTGAANNNNAGLNSGNALRRLSDDSDNDNDDDSDDLLTPPAHHKNKGAVGAGQQSGATPTYQDANYPDLNDAGKTFSANVK